MKFVKCKKTARVPAAPDRQKTLQFFLPQTIVFKQIMPAYPSGIIFPFSGGCNYLKYA